uniref:Uncharacterized protein n=1 Tax=Pyxicephalus adspersus TaxID=30357 RepID=A0AAV3AF63_PYXAD|nr:TPA: hypothetical protein GDO54_013789 [Pyxicephalus adspersus]
MGLQDPLLNYRKQSTCGKRVLYYTTERQSTWGTGSSTTKQKNSLHGVQGPLLQNRKPVCMGYRVLYYTIERQSTWAKGPSITLSA